MEPEETSIPTQALKKVFLSQDPPGYPQVREHTCVTQRHHVPQPQGSPACATAPNTI